MINKKDLSNNDIYIYSDTDYNQRKGIVGHLAIVVDVDVYVGVMTRCGGYEGDYVYYLNKDIQLEKWIKGDGLKDENV